MHQGHDPRDIDEYAWRDVALYLQTLDVTVARTSALTNSE